MMSILILQISPLTVTPVTVTPHLHWQFRQIPHTQKVSLSADICLQWHFYTPYLDILLVFYPSFKMLISQTYCLRYDITTLWNVNPPCGSRCYSMQKQFTVMFTLIYVIRKVIKGHGTLEVNSDFSWLVQFQKHFSIHSWIQVLFVVWVDPFQ